uniref:Merozoite antigen n=1 Tax=Theileria equi TaxID=5872 RepID=O76170_THEEQ|nr:merozoite antigen [Theileria equi]
MISKSFAFIFASIAISSILAEEEKPKVAGAVVDFQLESIDHVTIDKQSDGSHIVYTAHEGFAIEKIKDGESVIKIFDLKENTPKTVVRHIKDSKPYVVIAVESALHLVLHKDGDKWVELGVADFYETILFKGFEAIRCRLAAEISDKFTESAFGSGKKHTFKAPNKRVSKVLDDKKELVDGDKEVILDLEIFVSGDKKIARVVYLYKGDSRIKEIFFKLVDKAWKRVEVKDAAETLHSINSTFPSDYKTVYDGFSVYGAFLAVAAIAFSTLFY